MLYDCKVDEEMLVNKVNLANLKFACYSMCKMLGINIRTGSRIIFCSLGMIWLPVMKFSPAPKWPGDDATIRDAKWARRMRQKLYESLYYANQKQSNTACTSRS